MVGGWEVVRWIVRTGNVSSESIAILAQAEEMKIRTSSSSPPTKRNSRHPAVTLKKKKTTSADKYPWWSSSSQSSARSDGKKASKQSGWEDITRQVVRHGFRNVTKPTVQC